MFASSSGARVAFIEEVTWGTTPATPAFNTLRLTNRNMRTAMRTVASQERRADRNVPDLLLLAKGADGGYDFEWSYADQSTLLECALFSTFATNVIKNGIVVHSLTIEETLELGSTDSFSRFTGAMVSRYGLSMRAQQVVTGAVEFLAQKEAVVTAIIAGATYLAAGDYPIATATSNVADLTIGAISPAPRVMSLDFQIDNHLRERPIIGSAFSVEFGSGRCEVTGNMSCYFESNELYLEVLAHNSASLSFTLGDNPGAHMDFVFPKIFFGNGVRVLGGNDEDVMLNLPWQAVYDTGEACTMKVTRAAA